MTYVHQNFKLWNRSFQHLSSDRSRSFILFRASMVRQLQLIYRPVQVTCISTINATHWLNFKLEQGMNLVFSLFNLLILYKSMPIYRLRMPPNPKAPGASEMEVDVGVQPSGEGLRSYYITKIEELLLTVTDKRQNVRRLQVRRPFYKKIFILLFVGST